MWKARAPELLEEGRAAFLAHDFFLPQPPIPISIQGNNFPDLSTNKNTHTDASESTSAATSPTRVSFGFGDEHRDVMSEKELSGNPQKKPSVFLLRVVTHDWPNAFVTR